MVLQQATGNRLQAHFDSYSKSGDWSKLYSPPFTSYNYSFIIRRKRVLDMVDNKGGRVLDIGCGPGVMITQLIDKGYEYHGTDFSWEMIEEAKRRYAGTNYENRIHLRIADADNIDYPSNYFNGIICVGLFEYLTDFKRIFSEFIRVLKPGGFLVITIPKKYQLDRSMVLALTPARALAANIYHQVKGIRTRVVKRVFFTARQLDTMARQHGFLKDGFSFYGFTVMPYPFTVLLPRLSYYFNKPFENLHQASPAGFFATGYIGRYVKPLVRDQAI